MMDALSNEQPMLVLLDQQEPEIECDHEACDRSAEWYLRRVKCCPQAADLLLCSECKTRLIEAPRPLRCIHCNRLFWRLRHVIPHIEHL